MLKDTLSSALIITLLASGAPSSCTEYRPENKSKGINKAPEASPKIVTDGTQTHTNISYERAAKIAEENGITENYPSLYTYLENSTAGDVLIVQETSGSRNKYKTITPVIEVSSNSIYINCSYIRSEDDLTHEIQVGTYCRGPSKATRDSLEDAISDKHLVSYSKNYSWVVKAAALKGSCPAAMGLNFEQYHVLRCDYGTSDELTQNISIEFLSDTLETVFEIQGFEFAPHKRSMADRALVFWELRSDSPHNVSYRVIAEL